VVNTGITGHVAPAYVGWCFGILRRYQPKARARDRVRAHASTIVRRKGKTLTSNTTSFCSTTTQYIEQKKASHKKAKLQPRNVPT